MIHFYVTYDFNRDYIISFMKVMDMRKQSQIGLEGQLRSADSIAVLIDQQPFQFVNMNSHDLYMVISNSIGLSEYGKIFPIRTKAKV
jgi:hypothetical protein